MPGARVAQHLHFARDVHRVSIDGPTAVDRYVRRVTEGKGVRAAAVALSPLFPLGLPGAYIAAAYATAHWLRRRGRRGGPAIVTAAWCGWFAHRGAKLVFVRERPHRNGRRRYDSFPSGHTTGATALALTTAYVLRRERLISSRSDRARRWRAGGHGSISRDRRRSLGDGRVRRMGARLGGRAGVVPHIWERKGERHAAVSVGNH